MRVNLTWRIVEKWTTKERIEADVNRMPAIFATKATIGQSPKGHHLDQNTTQHLYTLNEIAGLMPYLPLAYMMRYIVTDNISKLYEIVNGTVGYLVGVKLAPNTKFYESYIIHGQDAKIAHTSKAIECIFLRIPGAKFPAGRVPGLPEQFGDDVFPIEPITKSSARVQLPRRKFNVSITQLPVVPAYVHTVHKTQSKTFTGVVIGVLRGKGSMKNVSKTAFYVAASRVEKADQLQLAWTPTENDLEYFKPPESLKQEMAILQNLANETIRNNPVLHQVPINKSVT
jgi:hypothetical protein